MPDARYCVVTDAETKDLLTEKHIQTFDYIKLVESTDWPMNCEPDVGRTQTQAYCA